MRGCYQWRRNKFFFVPLHFLALKVQLVVLVNALVMASTVLSVSCLLFYSRGPRAQPFVKVGGTSPGAPWSRRHWMLLKMNVSHTDTNLTPVSRHEYSMNDTTQLVEPCRVELVEFDSYVIAKIIAASLRQSVESRWWEATVAWDMNRSRCGDDCSGTRAIASHSQRCLDANHLIPGTSGRVSESATRVPRVCCRRWLVIHWLVVVFGICRPSTSVAT